MTLPFQKASVRESVQERTGYKWRATDIKIMPMQHYVSAIFRNERVEVVICRKGQFISDKKSSSGKCGRRSSFRTD